MMPESGSVAHEEVAVAKSPLDKPLQQLTEDDIAQVTREDCRRYLKEKGMRRPSWNKSQAIQQVIMLKALLETPADCDADFHKKLRISRPNKLHNNTIASESVPQVACRDADSALALDAAPYRRKDLDKAAASGGFAAANYSSAFTRTTVSTQMTVGQMTIFYSGEVNVYEDVPLDKAQEIMHIAASPILFPREHPVEGTVLMQSSPWFSKAVKAKACPVYNVIHLPSMQTVKTSGGSRFLGEESNTPHEENPVEESLTRKASVQRYLEKKKDRFKIKRKAGIASCSSLDIYFNHQMGNQITNEPLSGSDICLPPQIMPPSTPKRCSSVDNDFIQNIYTSSGIQKEQRQKKNRENVRKIILRIVVRTPYSGFRHCMLSFDGDIPHEEQWNIEGLGVLFPFLGRLSNTKSSSDGAPGTERKVRSQLQKNEEKFMVPVEMESQVELNLFDGLWGDLQSTLSWIMGPSQS